MAYILVVDDEPGIRSMLTDALEGAGHEVVTASDGTEAMRLYVARRPDVVITDLIMPRRSGIELIFELRRRDPQAAIIAISGVDEDFLRAGTAIGVRRVFAKPFDPRDLIAAVREIVG